MAVTVKRARRRDDSDEDEGALPSQIQVKHTIQLPASLWSKLNQRSRYWGISKSEALRRAIWLFTYVADRMDEQSEIIVQRPDGKQERLVISPY